MLSTGWTGRSYTGDTADVAPPRRVFLSHTAELRAYPVGRSFVAAAESAVSRAGDAIVDMAYFPVADRPPAHVCRDAVAGADALVLIAGFRYGSPTRATPGAVPHGVRVRRGEGRRCAAARVPAQRRHRRSGRAVPRPGVGDRQHAFRERLLAENLVAAQVASPPELETAVLHALTGVPHRDGVATYRVTVQDSQGVQIGDGGTQINDFRAR